MRGSFLCQICYGTGGALHHIAMNVSLCQAAAAMNANARWQEVIAGNLASGSTPGFKRQEVSFSAIAAGMMSPSTPSGTDASHQYALPYGSSFTNFRPGDLKNTGVNTDFAIEGAGFFEVQLPNGSTAYTRDGEFTMSPQGGLVTKQGYPVMGDSGPLMLDTSVSAPISVSADGTLSQGNEMRGKLKLVNFPDPGLLTPAGQGCFQAGPGVLPAETGIGTVRQGFLESANTSTMMEMTNLISALRMYEANQKVIQAQDERMGRLISELGNPS